MNESFKYELNFGDGQVPDLLEFIQLWESLPDDESRLLFHDRHIYIIWCMEDDFSLPHRRESYELIEKICDRIGEPYCKVLTAMGRKGYYELMFGRAVMSMRTVYEMTQVSDGHIPKSKKSRLLALEKNRKSDEKRLFNEYPEYARAYSIYKNLIQTALRTSDPDLKELTDRFNTVLSETSKKYWKSGELPEQQTTTCDYCKCFFSFERGQGVSIGRSYCKKNSECEKSYERETKQKERQKKQKISSKNDWVSSGKKRDCKLCECMRFVNQDGICKKCFSADRKRL